MTKKTCFFVTPIGEEDSLERKRSNSVLKNIIEPVCDELGFDVVRVDKLFTVDNIDSTIVEYLRTSELVITDMSGHNPNVFYEFGYRHGLKLPLIPLITEGENIPFDVTTLRTISYVTNDIDKLEPTKTRLKETIKSFDFDSIETSTLDVPHSDNTILLSLHDKLDKLISLAEKRNEMEVDRAVSLVAKHAQPQISEEVALMQTVIPTLLNNPNSIPAFMEMVKQFSDVAK